MDVGSNYTYLMNLTVISKFDACTSDIKQFFCREEGLALLDKVLSLSGTSGFIHRKKDLVDKLKSAGIACSLNSDISTIREAVYALPDGSDADRKLFNTLKSAFNSFVTPSGVIENLVKKLGDPELSHGSVRVSILKQFIKYTSYHTAPVLSLLAERAGRSVSEYRSNINLALSDIDDSIFDILETGLSKDDKKKYVLLRMIDDLANGRYKTNGSTKNALYMFAFAYDMSAFVDPLNDVWNPERDIEKKLFFDYYSNSFLRYISEDYKRRRSDYESEPLGDGINYKNYVEVIYLYCLSRKDMSQDQKLKLAERLIDECEKKVKVNNYVDLVSQNVNYTVNSRFTYIYKDFAISELMNLPVDEVSEYVCTHFEVMNSGISGSKLTIDMDTRTAGYYFNRKGITTHFDDSDIEAEIQLLKMMFPNDPDFIDLMGKLYAVLYTPQAETGAVVHRSDILTSFFYKALSDESLQGRSIYDLYIYMCTTLRPALTESRFQTVNSKNLFDMFVLITLYRQINII